MIRQMAAVIILVSIVIINSIAVKAGNELPKGNTFLIEFSVEKGDDSCRCNLSGIKVDVFSSRLTMYDDESNMSEFTHSFAFSVYSDKDGIVLFEKPSKEFLIIVDVSSLPYNKGIEEQTKFYRGDRLKDKIELRDIDNIEVRYDETAENGISVRIFDKAGRKINADYSTKEDKSNNDVRNLISDSIMSIKGVVYAGDKIIPYEYTREYSVDQRLNLIKENVDNGNIDKAEALAAYIDIYDKYGKTQELFECVLTLSKDSVFIESLSEFYQKAINEILLEPSYNKIYSSGRFEIRYTSSSSTTPLFITSLMMALQTADTSLCSGLSLSQPRSNPSGTAKYYVYVTNQTNGTALASCFPQTISGVRTSYIVIWEITDLSVSSTEFQNATISHEYMHAIMHTYRNNQELPKWFKESWSEWAIVHVNGLYDNTCPSGYVNAYLNNSYKSLIGTDNVYGKLLFPLYIRQNHGGDSVVADVVKNLTSTNNVYTAISNALYGTNTFDSIFPNYMRFVYTPKKLFNPNLSSWNNSPYLHYFYGLYSYPNNDAGGDIEPVSAHYREFAVPSSIPYHLDITINILYNYSTFSGKLLMTNASGMTTNWNINPSGSLVTYSTDITTSYIKGCVMFASTNKSLQTGYTLTISRS